MKKTVTKAVSVFMAVLISAFSLSMAVSADTAEEKPLGVSDLCCENDGSNIYVNLLVDPSFNLVIDDGLQKGAVIYLESNKLFTSYRIYGKAIVSSHQGELILAFPADQVEYYSKYTLHVDSGVVATSDMSAVNSAYDYDLLDGRMLNNDLGSNAAVFNFITFIQSILSIFNLIFTYI